MSLFEFKVDINGEPVMLRLKPWGDAPGAISRHNVGRGEAQVWAFLEWGLVEPKLWPPKEVSEEDQRNIDQAASFLESHGYSVFSPGIDVLDVISQTQIGQLYEAWVQADNAEARRSARKL